MPKLSYYYNKISQPCRAVEIFLRINAIPFKPKILDLLQGEHFEHDFSKINPFNRVPVIIDNGFVLTESVAILRYLCREYSVPDHWYPKDSKMRARVDEYLEWQHNETRAKCAMYYRVAAMIPLITGIQPEPNKLANYRKRMIEACDQMNNIWLKDGKQFLIGDNITIADLLGTAELEQLKMTDYDPCLGRPELARWMARVRQRTNPFYDDANFHINEIAKRAKDKQINVGILSKL